MTEKELYMSFNDVQNPESVLDEFNKPVLDDTKLLFYKSSAAKTIAFSTVKQDIVNYLNDGEEILFYMAADDPNARGAQACMAIVSGAGMIPFLSFGISNIIVATQDRLLQVVLDYALKVERFVSYPYNELQRVYTDISFIDKNNSPLYLILNFKDNRKVDCCFRGKHKDYDTLINLLTTISNAQHINSNFNIDEQLEIDRKQKMKIIIIILFVSIFFIYYITAGILLRLSI